MFSELSKVRFVEPEVNLPWTKLDFFFWGKGGGVKRKIHFILIKTGHLMMLRPNT
jgi:hypothetical protein